jgi:catechol 2,3-dioxygenase-like lactoylglutathione lyase family enzyme
MTSPLPWHHIHITHENRTEVPDWYAAHLGARIGKGTKRSENLWFGTNLIQVQSDTQIPHPRTGEIDHIGISSPNLSMMMQDALDGGATLIEKSLIEDPWGTRIMLMESDQAGFHHVHIICADSAVSSNWYAVNLGGDVVPCPWNGNCLAIRYDTMWMVFEQGEPIKSRSAARPLDHIGWYTSDIDQSVSAMIANGCQFPVPVQEYGPVRLAFAEDPSGLLVELVEPMGGKISK